MELSVFDLDHTLMMGNTSYLFGLYLRRRRLFSWPRLVWCAGYYARHKLFGMSLSALHQKIFKYLFHGHSLKQIHSYVNDFLNEEFDDMVRHSVVKLLKQAQAENHYTVILSSSPDFIVSRLAERLGVHEWKSSTYGANEGGFLDNVSWIMDGEDKARYVKVLQEKWGIQPRLTTVYSDSYLDLPVLKMAGRAVGVCPDRYLRKICLQEGWKILDER